MATGLEQTRAEVARILGEIRQRPKITTPEIDTDVSGIASIQRRLQEGRPTLIRPEMAKSMGLDIEFPEDWLMRISPGRNGDQPQFEFRSPEGFYLKPEEISITPEGRWVTPQAAEAVPGFEPTSAQKLLMEQYERLPVKTPAQRAVEQSEALEDMARRAVYERAFKDIFPDVTLDKIYGTIKELNENEQYRIDFLSYLSEIGHTIQTENLLRVIYPSITEQDFQWIFEYGVGRNLEKLPLGSFNIAEQRIEDIKNFVVKDPDGFRMAMLYEGRTPETEALLKNLYGDEAITEKYLKSYFEDTIANKFIRGDWLPDVLENYIWDPAMVGISDLFNISSGITDRLGADSLSKELKMLGAYGQVLGKDIEYAEPYSPGWFIQNLSRMSPMMLSLIGTSIITGGGSAAIVGAAGGGTLLQGIVATISSGLTASVGEGLMEAGDAYSEAESRGFSDEEKNAVFDRVFRDNVIAITGSNIAQYGLTFFVPGGKTASTMVKAATYGFDVVSEAAEEAMQLYIQRGALGDAQKFDQEMLQNIALGGAGGFAFAGIGSVYNIIKDKIESRMTDAQYDKFRNDTAGFMAQGYSREEAETKAYDVFAVTPEGQAIITETVSESLSKEIDDSKRYIPYVEQELKKVTEQIEKSTGRVEEVVKEHIPEEAVEAEKEMLKPEIPKAEAGMPEAGLQPSMIEEVPGKEVQPLGKGKLTQARMDDYARFEEYKGEVEEKASPEANYDNAQAELNGLRTTLEEDKVANYRFQIGTKKVGKGANARIVPDYRGLEFLISIREQVFPEFLTVKQAKMINPEKSYKRYQQKGARNYNKVPRDEVLYGVAHELGFEDTEALVERVMQNREARRRIRELETDIKRLRTMITVEKPASRLPQAVVDSTTLSRADIEQTLELFKDAISSTELAQQRETTIRIRKRILARRAANAQARAEELVIEGMSHEDAVKQANKEFLSGKLPTVDSKFMLEFSDEMRAVLFAKVYDYWTNVEPDYLELASTATALSNALINGDIPRKLGTGSRAFPEGGSAYLRLQRVFGGQEPILKALDEGKPLEDVVEGIFREYPQEPIPVDKATLDYLRGLSSIPYGQAELAYLRQKWEAPTVEDVRSELEKEYSKRQLELDTALAEGRIGKDEYDIESAIARNKAKPYPKVTWYEAPVEDGSKQMPFVSSPIKDSIVRVLKEIAMLPIDIGNFLRANKASFDFSFWRQQKFLIPQDVTGFLMANVKAWNATWSQKSAEATEQYINSHPLQLYYEKAYKAGYDFLRPLELKKGTSQWMGVEEYGYLTQERLIPRLTSKIPWVKLSQRAFTTGTNWHNWNIYCKWYEASIRLNELYASGKAKAPEGWTIDKEMMDCAKLLSDWTGRGSLGKAKPLAPTISAFFFAPRKVLGDLLTPRHLVSSNPRIRRVAWKNMTLVLSIIGGLVLLGKELDWWDAEINPKSADFMKIRVGNTRIDPWGGKQQLFVFSARVAETLFGDKKGVSSITGGEYELDPIGLITNFIRGKGSPLEHVITDFWVGRNFVGEEVDVANKKQWLERLMPFMIWDVYEAYNENEGLGLSLIFPAVIGEGIQTYTGDWKENWKKLGYPKYSENIIYNQEEPYYDMADFWADHAGDFKNVDPDILTEEKGFPPYIRDIAIGQGILKEISELPSEKLINLNADSSQGNTYYDYYNQWQKRKELVDAGDEAEFTVSELQPDGSYKEVTYRGEEAVKKFDQDDRFRNANLGNFSRQTLHLLNEYHKLSPAEQEKFLELHPELSTNQRRDWLISHPDENASLALFGKANVLSMEAYNELNKIIDEYDIPLNAIPEQTLPPKGSVENYFKYQELVDEYSANSWEVQLLMLQDDELRKWLGREPIDTPFEALELKIKNRDMTELYNSYSDKESGNYIADDDLREKFRDKLKEDNPGWVEDMRRIEAIENGGTFFQERWVDRGHIVDEFTAGSSEAKVWLIDNPDVHKWALEVGLLTDDGSDWNEHVLRFNVKWRDFDEEYEGYGDKDSPYYIEDKDERAEVRDDFLKANDEYRRDRRRRDAHGIELPEGQRFTNILIDKYVQFYEIPEKGYEDDLFLVDNQDFYQAMVDAGEWQEREFKPRWYYQIKIKNEPFEEEYSKIDPNDTEGRNKYLESHPQFKYDRRKLEAYDLGFPDNLLDKYVYYYNLPEYGYERERYLLANKDLYNKMIELKDMMPFELDYKVPSPEYDVIYHKWEDLFDQYDNVEGTASQREAARERIFEAHPDFEFDFYRRKAYFLFIPDNLVDDYAEWYTNPKLNKPEDYKYENWYEDDWWLMEHREFYDTMLSIGIWTKPRDFSKVPTRQVFRLYQTYQGLPTGKPREDFRKQNPELDAWLVLKFGYKPIGSRGDTETKKTPEQEAEEALRIKEWIERLINK